MSNAPTASTAHGPEEVAARLRAHDVTPTPQRLVIASVLFARPQHLSADELLQRVRAAGHAVSKATVYNTLGLFARRGLVREVIVDPAKVFYDSNTSDHHHLYHVDRGTLVDIESGAVAISALPDLPAGTVVEGVDVVVRVRSRPR